MEAIMSNRVSTQFEVVLGRYAERRDFDRIIIAIPRGDI
jgi:hypothetical protein